MNFKKKYLLTFDMIEKKYFYNNLSPFCEPQLRKKVLYSTLRSQKSKDDFVISLMWLFNLADNTKDLVSISKISKIPYSH